MVEFLVIFLAIIVLVALQVFIAKAAIALNFAFLAPLIYAAPFMLMAYVNFKDARKLRNLTAGARIVYRIRGAGFLLMTIPFFFKGVLPYFFLYVMVLFLLNLLICGVLEAKIAK